MFRLQTPVSDRSVDLLEAYLYETPGAPWLLVQAEPGDPFVLTGYFEEAEAGREAWNRLVEETGLALPEPDATELEDRDWKEAYKHHLRPWRYGPLAWVPPWESEESSEVADAPARVVLDSGMAFGTGSHETTRLCARALVDFFENRGVTEERRVIDAGSGSGILALSAAALGYRQVRGFDNDPEAVRISQENAEANGFGAEQVVFTVGDLEQGLAGTNADLLLANIETPILRMARRVLLQAVRPGGTLVMSGVLARDAEVLGGEFSREAETAWGTAVEPAIDTDGEWARLIFHRT